MIPSWLINPKEATGRLARHTKDKQQIRELVAEEYAQVKNAEREKEVTLSNQRTWT